MVFYVPQVVEVAVLAPEPRGETQRSAPCGQARLILDVQPSAAEIFSDGYYAGVPEDFSAARGGGVLEAGVHRIDVSAPGL